MLVAPDLTAAVADARRQNAAHSRPEFVAVRAHTGAAGARAGRRRQPGSPAPLGVRQGRRRPSRPQLHQRRIRGLRHRRRAAALESLVVGDGGPREQGARAAAADRDRRRSRVHEGAGARDRHRHAPASIVSQRAISLDDRIVDLREQIVRTSEVRFREGRADGVGVRRIGARICSRRGSRAPGIASSWPKPVRGSSLRWDWRCVDAQPHIEGAGGAPRHRGNDGGLRPHGKTGRLRQRRGDRGRGRRRGHGPARVVRRDRGPEARRRCRRRIDRFDRAVARARSVGGAARRQRVARERGSAAD